MQPVDWYSAPFFPEYSPTLRPTTNERYCDETKFNLLSIMKANYNVPEYEAARNAVNPYESLGKLGYLNRAALKLAEIDADILNSPQETSGVLSITKNPSTFVDIAGGPGGFTQYLQHKYPQIIGYGITLPGELGWQLIKLNTDRFVALNGDLYVDWPTFRNQVSSQQPRGVDLVTADGGFEIEDADQQNGIDQQSKLDQQETQSTQLILIEALLGLSLTKVGGNFLMKVFSTVSPMMVDLIYVLSLGFTKIGIVKPLTSRPANSERYLICLNRRNNNIDLTSVVTNYTPGTRLNVALPEDYQAWIIKHNNLSLDRQLRSAKAIFQFLAGQNVEVLAPDLQSLQRQLAANF